MKESGQRQDVAFLALAVAVLAIALALFVGMKLIPKERSRKPKAEATEQAATAEPPQEPAAKQPSGRDPFKSQARSTAGAAVRTNLQLKLVGIVTEEGKRPMAIIHSGKRRFYAKLGDRAAGYTVVGIGGDRAVLEGDGDRVTLVLREPEPE